MIIDLEQRRIEPELMDAPGLAPERHLAALDALARVNLVSLTAARAWAAVLRLHRLGIHPVRVLDVACGGGDVLHRISRRAQKRGVGVELVGSDVSPLALERARTRANAAGDVRFLTLDVLHDPIPGGFHLVLSSLFLHHLSRENAVDVLRAMAEATERTMLVQDLRRSRLGYGFAWVGLRMLTRSDVARHDGPVSVRSAFTLAEAVALCRSAGLAGAEVSPCWPQRFTIRWERS